MKLFRSAGRGRRAVVTTALLTALGVAGGAIYATRGDAKPTMAAPPAPVITAGPGSGSTTNSRSATFSFTDNQSGVTFKCSLDGDAYSTCSSPKLYTGLGDRLHTFQVAAQNGNSSLAYATNGPRSWTVDTKPPKVSLTFPANDGLYSAAAWNAGCSTQGMCGSASDTVSVSRVQLSLQRGTGPCWDGGSAFNQSCPHWVDVTGVTSWSEALSATQFPVDGAYEVAVRATDVAGNTTGPGDYAKANVTIDRTSPPPPVITQKPNSPTFDSHAHFAYTDAEARVKYLCSLDGAAFRGCGGTFDVDHLSVGGHTFQVKAVDRAGNVSAGVPAPPFAWTILVKKSFMISGSPSGLFYPGVSQAIDLSIGNPFDFSLRVLSVTVTVGADPAKPSCSAADNLKLANPDSPGGSTRTFTTNVVVPSGSTSSLSALGVPQSDWPRLVMPDLPSSQDSCANAAFTLTYSGTATKP